MQAEDGDIQTASSSSDEEMPPAQPAVDTTADTAVDTTTNTVLQTLQRRIDPAVAACALCVVWYGVVLWPGVNMMWSPHSYVRPTELHHGIASYSNMVLLAGTIAASSLPSCYCMSGLGTLDVLSQNRAERWQWFFSR